MNIILCLDDKNGILFNKRRQSRDRVLCERVLELSAGSRLLMNEYSAKIFPEGNIIVDENFLENAQVGDYCFIENADFLRYTEKIEDVIIYRWNRVYPSDVKIDASFFSGREAVSTEDFEGSSHDKITEVIYR